MTATDTLDSMDGMERLLFIRQGVSDALAKRPAAIVHARDVQHQTWLAIADAAGLSRIQVIRIYNATKDEATEK